jgi:D-lactate dehydrogenase
MSGKHKLELVEPVELVSKYLAPHLKFDKKKSNVVIHVPCSSKRMGYEVSFKHLASQCAENVAESNVPCCGMAGDRGLMYPELPASSLKQYKVSK